MKIDRVNLGGRISGTLAAAAVLACGSAAGAGVDVALAPEQPVALVGEVVRVRIVLTADSPEPESISSARVLLNWNPAALRLSGADQAGAVPLLSSGFPGDPYGLNEATVPQDGTALFLAFAPLATAIPVDQEGVLLGTLLFECLAPGQATVEVPPTAGLPATHTTIFDGSAPNLDITGARLNADVSVVTEPTELRLELAPDGPVGAGDSVTVTLSMRTLHGQPAAGFQAFLEFDPAELGFIAGSYTSEPFGDSLIQPIAATGGMIDLAAQVNVTGGQTPSADDALLATLAFQALRPGCVSSVEFRQGAGADSRLSDENGLPIGPLSLVDPVPNPALCECPCEVDGAPGIDVFDLLGYLDLWFVADAAAERTGDAPANIDVFDLLMYLDCWFAPAAGCQ